MAHTSSSSAQKFNLKSPLKYTVRSCGGGGGGGVGGGGGWEKSLLWLVRAYYEADKAGTINRIIDKLVDKFHKKWLSLQIC